MRYRRAQVEGRTYFFIVVTFQRINIFDQPDNAALLRRSIEKVRRSYPFEIDAFVLLPEHLHCIWTLPQNDADFSTRWRLIKSYFSRKFSSTSVGWVETRRYGVGFHTSTLSSTYKKEVISGLRKTRVETQLNHVAAWAEIRNLGVGYCRLTLYSTSKIKKYHGGVF
jgi:REP element-mobilizing transposase RayT